jgi:hypothetical protein
MTLYSIFKDKLFLVFFIPSVAIFVWSLFSISIDAYDKYSFVVLPTQKNWTLFIQIYKIPVSLGAFIVGLIALFNSLHRVDMQSTQLVDSKRLNEFNMYFKLKEEFNEAFSEIISEWLKKASYNNTFRLNEFFSDFDPVSFKFPEYKGEHLSKNTKVNLINLYSFCFGKGRNVFLSKNFREVIEKSFLILEQPIDIDENKISIMEDLNKFLKEDFYDANNLTFSSNNYESEWFSSNEKFHLSLSTIRLLAEISAFAGEPINCKILDVLCSQGNSIEHNLYHGPNMIMGERDQSPAGSQGRKPNLLSRHTLKKS